MNKSIKNNYKPIKKKGLSSAIKQTFITMDIETLSNYKTNKNSILTPARGEVTLLPYLLCWYDGFKDKRYFIDPSLGDERIRDIIYRAMKDICTRKYKGYKIYLHNFSKFDAIFLIKHLINIGDCDPVIHKGKIISFSFRPNWKKDFGSVTFLDSYLLLPNSLKKLGDSFETTTTKSIGAANPILLNDINYRGAVPAYKYFKNTSLEDYNAYKETYKNKIWDFKTESIKYCLIDCISLYQVLIKFNKLIFSRFKLNITDSPTLPSLAYSIFRSSFYKKEEIHQLSGPIDRNIRDGYTG